MQERKIILISLFPEIRISDNTNRKEENKKQTRYQIRGENKWRKKVCIEKEYEYRGDRVSNIVTIPDVYRIEKYCKYRKKPNKMKI